MAKFEHQKMPSPDLGLQDNDILFTKKPELLCDPRSDSGVASSSECPSASPQSDRSDNYPYGLTDYSTNVPRMENGSLPTSKIPYQEWFRNAFTKFSNVVPANDELPNQARNDNIFSPKLETRRSRLKQYRCKWCDFVTNNKLELWSHSKGHNGENMLECPTCPFVTEYKHHLRYHIRSHTGTKPYKCGQCDYSCISKAMLNSHLKTHSLICPYRCSDCSFATKYKHSLSLHLNSYNHKPAIVLNLDGSPKLEAISSSRRGPKVKTLSESCATPPQPQIPFNLMMHQNPLIRFPLAPGFILNHQNTENFQNIIKQRLDELRKLNEQQEPLDLSCKNEPSGDNEENCYEYDEDMTTMFDNVEIVENVDVKEEMPSKEVKKENSDTSKAGSDYNDEYEFTCDFCDVQFRDEVMFRIHRGYHSHSSPFTCSSCGIECENKVNFFIHIARAAH